MPIVDCVIGGSPCQDLSVAGKRAGLAGERSGLFMEQIRIIKEMRDESKRRSDKYVRPRFAVWENVFGAFSSNGGEDFRSVLEEFCRIADPAVSIPRPANGRWEPAGEIMGDGWSLAWRTHDAKYWGVPQRRRRIALVADFGGRAAPEILFERECVPRDYPQSRAPRETSAGLAQTGVGDAGGGIHSRRISYCIQGNCIDRADTAGCNGRGWAEDVSYTLNTVDRPGVYAVGNGQANQARISEKAGALTCTHGQQAILLFENHGHDSRLRGPVDVAQTVTENFGTGGNNTPFAVSCINNKISEINGTIQARASNTLNAENAISFQGIRRLTPLECERLQGFPDGWTDIGTWTDSKGKKHETTDSERYKALGNSIALPFWRFLLRRISAEYLTPPTMCSLFDGIGGFPLIWESINGKGTAVWASEIEEFPIAVTRFHFGGE